MVSTTVLVDWSFDLEGAEMAFCLGRCSEEWSNLESGSLGSSQQYYLGGRLYPDRG